MLEYKEVKISDLVFNDRNPRINDEAAEKLTKGIERYGFINPVVVNRQGNMILAGHTRIKALKQLGEETVPALFVDMDEATARGFAIWDNRSGEFAEWDQELLNVEIKELVDLDFDILGEASGGNTEDDEVPEVPEEPVTKLGDLWVLDGGHRILCGDSTNAKQVSRLMNGNKVTLVHADPPYGMGKENDGVINDNLYREKLDAFQMQWWEAFRPHIEDNGSVYIWGNAEDLWRLWYAGGLKDSERLTFRNEIVWDKKHGQGMESEQHRMFPTASERCLFFMLGEQGFNNNADNYWEGFEPIREYLYSQRELMGWNNKTVADFFGFHPRMADHWFSKSQWSFPSCHTSTILHILSLTSGVSGISSSSVNPPGSSSRKSKSPTSKPVSSISKSRSTSSFISTLSNS